MTTCVSGLRCGIYISMIFMSESIILILIFFFFWYSKRYFFCFTLFLHILFVFK